MMRRVILPVFIFSSLLTSAQEGEVKKSKREIKQQRIAEMARREEEGVVTYARHTAVGLKLAHDGYGFFLEVARAQSVSRSLLFQFEFAERKHPKEEKQQIFSTTTPLMYGKINFFYPVKLGVQQQLLLGNKGNKNGVSVTASGGGGIVLGLLRPYKADVQKLDGVREFVGYESADSSYFLYGPYYGGPDFSTGWSELQLTPGLYLKSALRFDYARYKEMVNALEVGLTAEFFSKKIPQMIYTKQRNVFLAAYVSILFGKRR
jgi:hypothetical protein